VITPGTTIQLFGPGEMPRETPTRVASSIRGTPKLSMSPLPQAARGEATVTQRRRPQDHSPFDRASCRDVGDSVREWLQRVIQFCVISRCLTSHTVRENRKNFPTLILSDLNSLGRTF
jgi:hypothetical protein